MKKIVFCIFNFCLFNLGITSFAQNTFPASGNAGIGTTSPLKKLHIATTSSDGIRLSQSGFDIGLLQRGNTFDFVTMNASGEFRFNVGGETSTKVTIANNGMIGVGSTPLAGLHLKGAGVSNFSQIRLEDTQAGGVIGYIQTYNGYLGFGESTAGADQLVIKGGKTGIGVLNPAAKLDIGSGGGTWTTAGWNKAIQIPNANVLKWGANSNGWRFGFAQSTNGFYFLRSTADDGSTAPNYDIFIANDGKIGMGTTSPTAKLELNGSFRLTNGSQGAGKVLVSDASGNATWQTPAVSSQWTTAGSDIYFNAGKVGIGTAAPAANLNVAGNRILFGGTSFTGTFNPSETVTQIQSASNNFLVLNSYVNGSNGNSFQLVTTPQYGVFGIYGTTSGTNAPLDFTISNGGAERLRVKSTGEVGIGTTNPIAMLEVGGGVGKLAVGFASSAALNYGTAYLGFNATRNASNAQWTAQGDGAHNGASVIFGGINGPLYFSTIPSNGTASQTVTDVDVANNVRMTINEFGQVRIGNKTSTVNSDYKLSVEGKIVSKEVVVTLDNWADFVFDPNYKLTPLQEVEKYYQEHKHLSEVPSASEVAKNGADLGELVKKQMQKIEELTMYLVQQQKEIDALKIQVNK